MSLHFGIGNSCQKVLIFFGTVCIICPIVLYRVLIATFSTLSLNDFALIHYVCTTVISVFCTLGMLKVALFHVCFLNSLH